MTVKHLLVAANSELAENSSAYFASNTHAATNEHDTYKKQQQKNENNPPKNERNRFGTVPLNVGRRRKKEGKKETAQSTHADQQRSDGSTEYGGPLMMSLTATMPVIVTVTLTESLLP